MKRFFALAMVVLLSTSSSLIEAVCGRKRYGQRTLCSED